MNLKKRIMLYEHSYNCGYIDTGWISSEGSFVREFEEKMSKKVGRRYGIAVSNGTAELEIAIQALGIGAGDEVSSVLLLVKGALHTANAATPLTATSPNDRGN